MAGLTLTTAPAAEPLSRTDAKLHLRVDDSADDDLIDVLIRVARQRCEDVTRRSLITTAWKLTLHSFPSTIYLPRPPVQVDESGYIVSLKYYDTAGDQQTLDAGEYDVLTTGVLAEIMPAYSYSWPSIRSHADMVEVNYKSGYGDAATDVEEQAEPLIQGMKLLIGHLYENREGVVVGVTARELPVAVRELWYPYRILGKTGL